IPMADVVVGIAGSVFDGTRPQRIYDQHIIRDQPTIRLRTRRGLEICGSENHRVLLADGVTWRRLDELAPGDSLSVSGGGSRWPEEMVELRWEPARRITLSGAAAKAGVSVWTIM